MTEKLAKQFGANTPETDGHVEQTGEQQAKVEARFNAKRGILLLGIGGRERLDESFVADLESQDYTPKDELHMTVIGFKQGNQLKKVLKYNPELTAQVAALAEKTEWDILPTGEKYLLTKQYEGEVIPRQSIIEMVSCPGGEGFIRQLNTLTGLQLEEQPPHVTLATRGNPQGIGVNTGQDIADFGQRIT